jgi:tRNA dimethylallyltransferase
MSRFVAIVGPTASGKTALGLALAERLGGEIVSCDSMQVYRGLDIGTAKPSAAERARVPHHLLDVADVDETFDAARYARLADDALAELDRRGKPALVVGGTGLYLRALRFGLLAAPPADAAIRARHQAVIDREGPEALHRQLAAADPETAAQLAPADRVRVSRALELQELTGVPASQLRRAHRDQAAASAPRHDALVLVLGTTPAMSGPTGGAPFHLDPALRAPLHARVLAMLAAGWLDEVRAVVAAHGPDVRPLGAIGYRELCRHLAGELDLAEATLRIRASTWQFARRQVTWFAREPGARSLGLSGPLDGAALDGVVRLVESFLAS